MLAPGVYPASVTPFDARGRLDGPGLARVLAWFEAAGCRGAVLAGTNGEGPSLSAGEKRDLARLSTNLRGELAIILGLATSSLEEAVWLARHGAEAGAVAVLALPPSYFKPVDPTALRDWFLALLDRSPLPVLAYNFPQKTGVPLDAELLAALAAHPNLAGAKDSSGESANLAAWAEVLLPHGKQMFVGDETLLLDALRAGWSGTISGAANVVPDWLSVIVEDWHAGKRESAETKFELLLPVIKAIRSKPQPATNKALLHGLGVLPSPDVRLPLLGAGDVGELEGLIAARLGPRKS